MTVPTDVAAFLAQVASQPATTNWDDPDEAGAQAYLDQARQPRSNPAPLPPGMTVTDTETSAGTPVRIYRPADTSGGLIAYFHGGGWVMGDVDLNDAMCRVIAQTGGFTLVSVDYRLSPEHPYPAPLEDCYAATCWAAEQIEALTGGHGPLIVMGSSAGGNLAAAISLLSPQRQGPTIDCQALIYPMLDDACDSPSYLENAKGFFIERGQLKWYWDQYLPDGVDRDNPIAVPARAIDLAGQPPAVVVCAEHDPLRDEGAEYAERLRAAAVPVDYRVYEGQIHGFMGLIGVLDRAEPAAAQLARSINALLASNGALPGKTGG